ncbi:hypothetical protein Dsin_009173 [Dipteronia sinensis]|uniref:PTC1-like winged helix-turn-helix domain-containing protein n=1 Tax=Dipteronia sinensis TaxID=43782 RepID=A0AAE0AQ44_9ROSI|nr:hypothetical protein Dsin_009173 [Dipteronia sinensis]
MKQENTLETGLIDFLLKTIHKTVVEDRIVRRSINPITKLLEFYLQDVQKAEFTETKTELHSVTLTPETGRDVYGDMLKLYKNVLLGYPESHPGHVLYNGQICGVGCKNEKSEEDLDRVWSGAGRSCDMEVEVRGCGLDLGTELSGAENWTVDCVCEAKDGDGERMEAREICQVWQHTRCNSIDDHEAVPCVFLCRTCKAKSISDANVGCIGMTKT